MTTRPQPVLDAIGVVAQDVAAAITFYRRVGVPFPAAIEIEDHVECPLGSGMRLMIDSADLLRSIDPGWAGSPGERVAFAARLPDAAAVDALYAELAADGHGRIEPYDAPWGQRYASVSDPDGVKVDLYAWLPGRP